MDQRKKVVPLKITNFWKKNCKILSVWWVVKMKIVTMLYNSSLFYSSTFYSLFIPFFVLKIFKFKYLWQGFCQTSASISRFKWFEKPWIMPVSLFFHNIALGLIRPQIPHPPFSFFADFPWNMLGDSINWY